MPVQVQCPNCGGYEVFTLSQYINRITGKKINVGKAPGRILAVFTAIALLFLNAYLTPYVGSALPIHDTTTAIIFALILVVIVPIVVCILMLRFFTNKRRRELAQAVKMNNSDCSFCRYSWTWPDDHPRTDINVDPEKIQRGKKRLEEERIAEKRRQDAMAAWYLQQQREKRQ